MTKSSFQVIPFFGEPEKKEKFIEFQKTEFSGVLMEFMELFMDINSSDYESFMCTQGIDVDVAPYQSNNDKNLADRLIQRLRNTFKPEYAEYVYIFINVPPTILEIGTEDEEDEPISYRKKIFDYIDSQSVYFIKAILDILKTKTPLEIQVLLLNLDNSFSLKVDDMSLLDKINEYEDTSSQISDEIVKLIPAHLLQTYMLQFDKTLLAKRIRKLL
ncbi:hypothetical protein LCGC14_1032340 [marine sediment metagenome]|uniref:Uncharacterized protein n=1 Tax=marine sediment metagenome TaxID=412755 RepID=A0A0F9R085_9ZZZZ